MGTGSARAPAMSPEPCRSAEIEARLRRVEGQVRGIRRMYEDGRACLEILDQLSAARAALGGVAMLVLEDHVRGCSEPAAGLSLDEQMATQLLTAIARVSRR